MHKNSEPGARGPKELYFSLNICLLQPFLEAGCRWVLSEFSDTYNKVKIDF
jgi:hypothetical protein